MDLFAIAVPIKVKYSLQVFYEKFSNTSNTPFPYLLWEMINIFMRNIFAKSASSRLYPVITQSCISQQIIKCICIYYLHLLLKNRRIGLWKIMGWFILKEYFLKYYILFFLQRCHRRIIIGSSKIIFQETVQRASFFLSEESFWNLKKLFSLYRSFWVHEC